MHRGGKKNEKKKQLGGVESSCTGALRRRRRSLVMSLHSRPQFDLAVVPDSCAASPDLCSAAMREAPPDPHRTSRHLTAAGSTRRATARGALHETSTTRSSSIARPPARERRSRLAAPSDLCRLCGSRRGRKRGGRGGERSQRAGVGIGAG